VFIRVPKPEKESDDELIEHIKGLCKQEGARADLNLEYEL
jgi:hypothetical protein